MNNGEKQAQIHPDGRRTERNGMYDIKQLWQRSHEIIGMALLGHSNKAIAQMLDITPQTVSNTLNGPLGKEKLEGMREERDEEYKIVAGRVNELVQRALDTYEEIFDNENISYNLKKSTADTVALDLAGHRAPTKVDSRHVHMTATLAEIEEFKARGRAAMAEAGATINITLEEPST